MIKKRFLNQIIKLNVTKSAGHMDKVQTDCDRKLGNSEMKKLDFNRKKHSGRKSQIND